MSDEPTPPPLDRHETLTVGVIVERRKAKSAWQDYVWQPVEVVMVVPPLAPWSVMREEGGTARFFAGAFTMELFPNETVSYRMNLIDERPGIYVVLREDSASPLGMALVLVSPSPADAEAYMEGGQAVVDKVPMPEGVAAWLAAYVETFHVDEQFRKRKRGRDKPKAGSVQ
jgi:hypothetical protein